MDVLDIFKTFDSMDCLTRYTRGTDGMWGADRAYCIKGTRIFVTVSNTTPVLGNHIWNVELQKQKKDGQVSNNYSINWFLKEKRRKRFKRSI